MCAAMIMRLAAIASLAAIALASPIPSDTGLVRCVESLDSRGIECPEVRHQFYCDNLPGVRAGT